MNLLPCGPTEDTARSNAQLLPPIADQHACDRRARESSCPFLLGAPGNLLVIWIIWRHVKPRSHTILLILHLAAADLLVLITLPLWIHSLLHSWVFGQAVCKAITYVVTVSMYSSIFLITLMSVERFVAVRYPFAFRSSRTKTILDASLMAAWVLALALGIPVMSDPACGGAPTGIVVPISILSVCSCLVATQLRAKNFQAKKQVMVLITSVVVAFILCWLPHHINNIIELVCTIRGTSEEVPESAKFISGALVFVSSSVNPVLYAFAARRSKGFFNPNYYWQAACSNTTVTWRSRICVALDLASVGGDVGSGDGPLGETACGLALNGLYGESTASAFARS
ncbi:hypothetical protein CRUP_004834 [Coryphaenoides rupestris]|nr:hypothetical protein CRUP_004834 [Coryphaenoides rupestris]